MDSDDSDDAVVYLEHDAVSRPDQKCLRRKISSFTDNSDLLVPSRSFVAPKFRRTSIPNASVSKNRVDFLDITDISPDGKERESDDYRFNSYTPQSSFVRKTMKSTSREPIATNVPRNDHNEPLSRNDTDDVLHNLLALSPTGDSKKMTNPTLRAPLRSRPPPHAQSRRPTAAATTPGIDFMTDRPAHWGSGGSSLHLARPAAALSRRGPTNRRQSSGGPGEALFQSSKDGQAAASRRVSLPLTSSQNSQQPHSSRGAAAGTRPVSFQPSFLLAASCRKNFNGGTSETAVETGSDIGEEDMESDRSHAVGDSAHPGTALHSYLGMSPVRDGPMPAARSPPDSTSPPTRRRFSSSGRKFRKGSLSQQMQSVLRETGRALVRFSSSRSQWAPIVVREIPGGGWEQCLGGPRDGDLLDPRNRTREWVDVEVIRGRGAAAGRDSRGDGRAVATLRVRATGQHYTGPVGNGDDAELAEGTGHAHPQESSAVPSVGAMVWGHFNMETCRAMGVLPEAGAAMRIYDFVFVPASYVLGRRQECTGDVCTEKEDASGEIAGVLFCTELCESISLTDSY